MAEFTVVMRQAKRMCDAHSACGMCPLGNSTSACDGNKRLGCIASKCEAPAIERIVMDWAANNPEPVYPSWNKGWRLIFPNGSQQAPCPADFDVRYKPDGGCSLCASCDVCKERPIPAEIAEKLGIEPIGGSNDEKA